MFASPEAALKFAFRMRGRAVMSSPSGVFMTKERMKSTGSSRLTSWDYHAQAGMVFSRVNRMPMVQQAWVFFEYGNPMERRISAKELADSIAGRADVKSLKLSKSQIVSALMARTVRGVAKELGSTHYRGWKMRGVLMAALETSMMRTMSDIWEWMGHPE